jgi:predicted nucleotidyltransferase
MPKFFWKGWKNKMIDIDKDDLAEVRRILNEHVRDCEVRVFGSRIEGKARRFSDLDLALVGNGKLDWRRIESLKDVFAASNLSITVDIVDWHAITDEFRAIIEKHYEIIQPKPETSVL